MLALDPKEKLNNFNAIKPIQTKTLRKKTKITNIAPQTTFYNATDRTSHYCIYFVLCSLGSKFVCKQTDLKRIALHHYQYLWCMSSKLFKILEWYTQNISDKSCKASLRSK